MVVSDQWLFSFAPFPGHLQHEAYAVFVPEETRAGVGVGLGRQCRSDFEP